MTWRDGPATCGTARRLARGVALGIAFWVAVGIAVEGVAVPVPALLAAAPAHAQALTEDEANAILRGLRPDAPAERPSVDLEVSFGYDSASIRPDAAARLDAVAEVLRHPELASMQFEIAGHTDAQGDDGYNLGLSQRRAEAVLRYLVEIRGLPAAQFVAIGYGETRLKDAVNPASAVNRRVELVNVTPHPDPMPNPGPDPEPDPEPQPDPEPRPDPEEEIPQPEPAPADEEDEPEEGNVGGIRF